MENEYLQILAQIVLPAQILDYFTIAGIEQTATEIHIGLDEKMHPDLKGDAHFRSFCVYDAGGGLTPVRTKLQPADRS